MAVVRKFSSVSQSYEDGKNFMLVYFPSNESTAVIANTSNVVVAGDICENGTISVLWRNGMIYIGRVVNFNGKCDCVTLVILVS